MEIKSLPFSGDEMSFYFIFDCHGFGTWIMLLKELRVTGVLKIYSCKVEQRLEF